MKNQEEAVARASQIVGLACEAVREICKQEGVVFESPQQEKEFVSVMARQALAESPEFFEAIGSAVWYKVNGEEKK